MELLNNAKTESGLEWFENSMSNGHRAVHPDLSSLFFPAWQLDSKDIIEVIGKEGCGKTSLLARWIAKILSNEKNRQILLINSDCNLKYDLVLNEIHKIGSSLDDRLKIINLKNYESFQLCLSNLQEILLSLPKVGVIMIDSLGAYYEAQKTIPNSCSYYDSYVKANLKILAEKLHLFEIPIIYSKLKMPKSTNWNSQVTKRVEIVVDQNIPQSSVLNIKLTTNKNPNPIYQNIL